MISESQLETWSNQGATVTAENTHNSIRTALTAYANWPDGVKYETYLQGSYRNSTNIRGDSDVDLVVELTSLQYSNLSQEEKKKLGLEPANYSWSQFRLDVISALRNYYENQLIDTSGSKSVKVLPASGRLKADVVVCANYKNYSHTNLELIAEGMTFWTIPSNNQIINYPKIHYTNGADKNSQTNNWYKPTIRIFKNARNRVIDNNPFLAGRFPSYFVECLLYNVPHEKFGISFQNTFLNLTGWLRQSFINNNVDKFICQNRMYYLFGSDTNQWNVADAQELVNDLIILWNG